MQRLAAAQGIQDALLRGLDPRNLRFDQSMMRAHLARCFRAQPASLDGLELEVEDARNNVWAILNGASSRLDFVNDLLPVWIARNSNEQVRLAHLTDNSHGILEKLLHVPVRSHVGTWQDNLFAGVLQDIVAADTIREALV